MRNAAMVLGIIGGAVGMIVGFFGYGFAEALGWITEFFGAEASRPITERVGTEEDYADTKIIAIASPILGIAGGAMSPAQPVAGAILMLVSAVGMFHGFGFGAFTMFPIAMCAVAGLLGLAAAFAPKSAG